VEIEANNAAFLTGAGFIHLAAKGHGMQRDVVTVTIINKDTHREIHRDGVDCGVWWLVVVVVLVFLVVQRLRACECQIKWKSREIQRLDETCLG